MKSVPTLCFAALVLVACSQDTGESDRRNQKTDEASRGDGGKTAEIRTVPQEGTLPAGRYSTGERFEPPFSFELGEGWLVLRTSSPRTLKLGYTAPGQEVAQGKGLRFLNVRGVFEPRERGGDARFEAKPVPDDLVAWLQRHPYVSTGEPEPVSVGGVPGKQLRVNVDVPEGLRDVQGGCAVPCIPLLRSGSDSVTYITEGSQDSFIILEDIEGETVVVIISAPADKFDEFLPKAQKVLQNVEWKEPRPAS